MPRRINISKKSFSEFIYGLSTSLRSDRTLVQRIITDYPYLGTLIRDRRLISVVLTGSHSYFYQSFHSNLSLHKPNGDVDLIVVVKKFSDITRMKIIDKNLLDLAAKLKENRPFSISMKFKLAGVLYSIKFFESNTLKEILQNLDKNSISLTVLRNSRLNKNADVFYTPLGFALKYNYKKLSLGNYQLWLWDPPQFVKRVPVISDILTYFAITFILKDDGTYYRFSKIYKSRLKKMFSKYNARARRKMYTYFVLKHDSYGKFGRSKI